MMPLSDWLHAESVTPEQYQAERKIVRQVREASKKQRYRQSHPAYVQRETQKITAKRANNRPLLPFASVDGEGAPGRHDKSYVRMTAGKHELIESEPGKGLQWDEILDWLCNLPKNAEYVAFAFDYDAAMILCGYAEHNGGWPTLIRLVKNKGSKPVLLSKGNVGWWVTYRPKMEFKVSPTRACPKSPSGWCNAAKKCDRCGSPADSSRGHMIRISDTIKLFQSSLVATIDDWEVGTPEEREKIKTGKDSREFVSYLDPAERAEVDEYNRLEVKLHAEIMESFRKAWIEAELPLPANWQSPGSLAKALLRHYKVPGRKEIDALDNVPKEVWEISTLAYLAGWFEVSMFGPVPGIGMAHGIYDLQEHQFPFIMDKRAKLITELDLTSAYPWAMTSLPCLRHSHWEHCEPESDEYGLVLADARYEKPLPGDSGFDPALHDDFPIFMGLPHRDEHGRVTRPLHTIGWYWNFEVAEARHQTVTISDGWTWVPDGCDCNMWSFVQELYELRQSLGKSKGKPVKLGINSLYGVTAQRKRGQSEPPFLNTVAASFITAWTRATMMRTIHQVSCERDIRCGSNVVMVATDAAFFIGNPGIQAWDAKTEKEKAQLGDWTRETFAKGLFIAQGGIYWPIGEPARSKTRGVPASIIQEHVSDFHEAYKRLVAHDCQGEKCNSPEIDHGIVRLHQRRTPDGRVVPAQRFVGLYEAVHRNAKSELGRFVESPRRLAIDWTTKRQLWLFTGKHGPIWTLPKHVDNPVSQPYEPVSFMGTYLPEYMASEDTFLDLINDSPEWMPQIIAPAEDEGFNFGE